MTSVSPESDPPDLPFFGRFSPQKIDRQRICISGQFEWIWIFWKEASKQLQIDLSTSRTSSWAVDEWIKSPLFIGRRCIDEPIRNCDDGTWPPADFVSRGGHQGASHAPSVIVQLPSCLGGSTWPLSDIFGPIHLGVIFLICTGQIERMTRVWCVPSGVFIGGFQWIKNCWIDHGRLCKSSFELNSIGELFWREIVGKVAKKWNLIVEKWTIPTVWIAVSRVFVNGFLWFKNCSIDLRLLYKTFFGFNSIRE